MVAVPVPNEDGLAMLRAAVADLTRRDLSGCDDHALVAFAREFETLRNQLSRVDHQILIAIDTSGIVDRLVARNPAGVLSQVVGMSKAEARRRAGAADALSEQTTMTGEPVGARYPALAGVERVGLLGREHRDVALGCLRILGTRFGAPAEVLAHADRTLAEHAPDLDPDGLRTVAQHIIDVEYPGGLLPDDAQVEAARQVQLTAKPDGSYRLTGILTGETGAMLATVLDTYGQPSPRSAAPRSTDSRAADATDAESATVTPAALIKDLRSPAQRRHDALLTACRALLRSDLPQHGGVPTSVIVTITLDDLLHGAGAGRTTDGQDLSPATVARLLHEAEVLPTVVDGWGRVRWQETQQRCATPGQTKFLIARDGGCSFPGCDEPPSHCDRHHIVPWAEGGTTEVGNLTLLCGYHHREFLGHGWACRLINDLPHWIPPGWVDPTRTPRLHPRIRIRRTTYPKDTPRRT
ncbi:MAG: DUF222 domain-containing protein [Propionibacteriaceae bacterium]